MGKNVNRTGYVLALDAKDRIFQWETMSPDLREAEVNAWRTILAGCVSMEIMHQLGNTAQGIQAELSALFDIEGYTQRYEMIHQYIRSIVDTYWTATQKRKGN